MRMALEERETHFNMAADDHSTWHVFTDDPFWIRRLEKVGAVYVRTVGEGKEYTLPANYLAVRKPRIMSDAQASALKMARQASQRL